MNEGNITEYSIQLKIIKKIFDNEDVINSSSDVVRIMNRFYDFDDREKLYVMLMDSRKKVIGINLVSVGTIDKVIMNPREVFKPAILLGASSIIMIHNHPSLNVTPSMEDRIATDRIIKCGNILDIPLMDHIIYSENNYYSIYDEMD